MKKFVIVLIAGILSTLSANAQLGKQMSKYHEKDGITVTLLDQSLFGLYQRNTPTPEIREMLGNLKEVNLLNLDLNSCPPDLCDKIIAQFRNILNNPDKYRLVKSQKYGPDKQLIYTQSKNEKIIGWVVWNQTPDRIDLLELQGDIRPEQIALLPEALNLPGLDALAFLSGKDSSTERNPRPMTDNIRDLGNGLFDGFDNMLSQFFGPGFRNDSTAFPRNPFEQINQMMGMFDNFPDITIPDGWGENGDSRSSSVQIIEENGKTKLKIDAQNTDIIYVIDGQERSGDSIQIPETIQNAQLIPSRQDAKKTYLFITSKEKLGEFASFKDGELTFRYNHQEFKYNLDKLRTPILIIDGRLSAALDINPADILQIRPVSQIEREAGYYPDAEVIINTRQQFPF